MGKIKKMDNNAIRVGIDAEIFNTWGGGIDFILMISSALMECSSKKVFLLVPKNSLVDSVFKKAKCFLISVINDKNYRDLKKKELINNSELIESFKECLPEMQIVYYGTNTSRFYNDTYRKKVKCMKKYKIDVLLPSISYHSPKVHQIGYIYDFQHRYYTEYFSEQEINRRNNLFEMQLNNSKTLIVNSIDTKNDIEKFYPNHECKVFVLPFKPFLFNKIKEVDVEKYKLPKHFYMISNQFWKHKSHITAFNALELLYNSGKKDLYIVCTGKMEDYRDDCYTRYLKEYIDNLNCKDNIIFLGFIPKQDQLCIIKKAEGMIQPTLFEGGPGGGSVYNALCLGVPCLVSSIDINREIVGYDNVFYFEPENALELADLMKNNYIKEKDINVLNNKNEKNKMEFGRSVEKIIDYELRGEI